MKKYKEEFNSAIDETQEHVTYLEYAHDDLVKYGRHLCVRVEDITVATDETADKVLEKVKNIKKKKACPSFSGNVIDWAHHIRRNFKFFKTNNTCHSIILHFNSFKHRTSFCRNRNKLKGVQIKLDLTKKRYNV